MGKAEPVTSQESEETALLRDSAITFCSREAPVTRLQSLKLSDADYDPGVWQAMVELGWSAILVPERAGGLGLDIAAAAVVAEELGKVAAPEPYCESAGLATLTLASLAMTEANESLLAMLAAGEATVSPAFQEIIFGDANDLPRASVDVAGWALEGTCRCVPCARSATLWLVPAIKPDGELALFAVPHHSDTVTVNEARLADRTSHATLVFDRTSLTSNACVAEGPEIREAVATALDGYHLLTAAYLCGLMSTAYEVTLDYLKTRKQFGQTIGTFQALQHRTVDLFIQREIASAVTADALRSKNRGSNDTASFASRAQYRCIQSALAITREAIQLHGAIGFTYECDIGHFLNRALVVAARFGNADWHLGRLTTEYAAFTNEEDVATTTTATPVEPHDKNWNALADDDFRLIVRHWFEEQYPEALRYPPRRLRWHEIKDWYLQLSEKGWLAPSWPVEYGGMGLSPAKTMIFIEEQERWGVARAPDMGITMIGPLLIQHGTEAQREQYLPKILAGENVWCQGYSEPNSGSDLASLQCEAILDGDEFVVNGQKTWTTLAQDATHMFLLVRTDKTVKQQKGISFLLVDFNTPGITVRPIRNIAGDEEFCEVFFDDVRVPAENLVGELNSGWTIAKALLSFERIFLGSPKQSQYALQRLESIARGSGLMNDRAFIDRYMRLKLDVVDLESIYARYAQIVRDGGTLGPDVSLLKIWATETFSRLTELMIEAAAERGAESGELLFGDEKANVLSQFYNARPATIYGGSNEIQRNIIAKMVLGLG